MDRDYNEDNPGPGAYYASDKLTNRAAPKHTFGLKTTIWFDHEKPGPGTYNLRRDGNTSPKYTMGDRYDIRSGTETPGPGTYHSKIKLTHRNAPAYTMQGPTMYNPDRGIPGPGTYDLRGELSGPAYSLGQKFSPKLSTTPGPGTYSPNSPSSAPAYSMGQHLFESRSNTPGPGTYNLRSADMQGPMFSMGKRFYRLRDRKKERRYSNALKQRPHPQGPHSRPATNSRGASRPLTARKLQFSEVVTSPSMRGSPMSSDSSLADLIKSRAESPWNIQRPSTAISQDTIMLATQPPNLKLSFRPRPTTSAEHVARRRAYMIGPTEDPNYNEYMRNMSRYSALKGVAHGHVAQWGRSKSFIRATKPNKKW